jgi:hypothetical protein
VRSDGTDGNGQASRSMDGDETMIGLSLELQEARDFVQVGDLVSIHPKDGNMDGQIGSSELLVAVDAMEFRDRFGLNAELNDDDIVVSVSAVVSFSTSTVTNTCFWSSVGLI